MAYYYSDADLYPYPYQHQHQHQHRYQHQRQYQHQYQYQYDYQYQYCYAPTEALIPRTYCYSDRFNAYEVNDGYYYWQYGDQSTRYPIAYSVAAGYSEPKRVELEDGGVEQLNMDGEFDDDDDYDPTPYGGGYDIVAAYGKPLPASDAICYPRSGNNLESRAAVVSDAAPAPAPAPVPDHVLSNAIVTVDEFESDSDGEGSDSEMSEGSEDTSDGDAILSGSSLDHDCGGGGFEEQYGDGLGDREAVSIGAADELSSESPGFCDGFYGYLPCLNKKRNRAVISDGSMEKADEDQWKDVADFLFGSLDPYADGVPGYTTQSYV